MHAVERVRSELKRIGIDDLVRVADASTDERYVYLLEEPGYGYGHPTQELLDELKKIPDNALIPRPEMAKGKEIREVDDQRQITHVRGELYQMAITNVPLFGYNANPGADDMSPPEVDWLIGGHPGDYRQFDKDGEWKGWSDVWNKETDPVLTLPEAVGDSRLSP